MKFIPEMKRKNKVNNKTEARQRLRMIAALRIGAVVPVDQSQGMDRHQMREMPVRLRQRIVDCDEQPAVFAAAEIREFRQHPSPPARLFRFAQLTLGRSPPKE